MEQFSNGAILKWSDSQMEQFSNGAIWGRYHQLDDSLVGQLTNTAVIEVPHNIIDLIGEKGSVRISKW